MGEFDIEEVSQEIDKRVGQSKIIAICGLIFSIIFSVFSIGSILSAPDSTTRISSNDSVGPTAPDTSWAPADFTIWSTNPEVAYRWATKSVCDNYGCVQAEFVSKNGCPNSFYAAINWLDSADSVVSYDNSTLPSLNPLQIAKLRFDDIEGSGKSAQMAEINCR